MRRALHILVRVATAASLLLCVGVCAMWVRSYHVADCWHWWRGRQSHRIHFESGEISLWVVRLPSNWPVKPGFQPWADVRYERTEPGQSGRNDLNYSYMAGVRQYWRFLGFRRMVCDGGQGMHPAQGRSPAFSFLTPPNSDVTIPHWFPALLLSVLPASWLARRGVRLGRAWRKHRRKRSGQCPTCGYDLRASPDRCPECGTAAGGGGGPVNGVASIRGGKTVQH